MKLVIKYLSQKEKGNSQNQSLGIGNLLRITLLYQQGGQKCELYEDFSSVHVWTTVNNLAIFAWAFLFVSISWPQAFGIFEFSSVW